METILEVLHDLSLSLRNHIRVGGALKQIEVEVLIDVEFTGIVLTNSRIINLALVVKITLKVMVESFIHFRNHVGINPRNILNFTLSQ